MKQRPDRRWQSDQVAVAVVHRSGVTNLQLRDRFSGTHTLAVATYKAWTAVSFRTANSEFARAAVAALRDGLGRRGLSRAAWPSSRLRRNRR